MKHFLIRTNQFLQIAAILLAVHSMVYFFAGCDGGPSGAASAGSEPGARVSFNTTNPAPSESGAMESSSMNPAMNQSQTANRVPVKVFNKSGELIGPIALPIVERSDSEWRSILTPEQFRILRKSGTEAAFCGTLLDNKTEGVYTCAGCGLPLFSSDSKFNSRTGWPSFFQPIADENVAERSDTTHGMVRTEINCARCDGHLGHVFEDGPRPTGLRYCLNSESLYFTPSEDVAKLADPAVDEVASANADKAKPANSDARRTAVFAGGCFWCVEAVFEELAGVIEAVSGYAGGDAKSANYRAVGSGRTSHAEAVEIIYDPAKISYEELLRVHFATHDPTQLNRQGNDVGPQYRSAIFYANDQEKRIAEAFIQDLNEAKVFNRPIVTTLEPLDAFHAAEAYHQNYVCENPNQSYVRSVALPKVEKVRKQFKDKLKSESPLERNPR